MWEEEKECNIFQSSNDNFTIVVAHAESFSSPPIIHRLVFGGLNFFLK